MTDCLSRLLDPAGADGEGLYWTGSGTVGSDYPPFQALLPVGKCGQGPTPATQIAEPLCGARP